MGLGPNRKKEDSTVEFSTELNAFGARSEKREVLL